MASTSSFSDADIATLKTIGEDTIRNIVALVVEAVLYTVYFILVVFAGRILLSRERRNKVTIATFAVVLIMLFLDTSLCILDVKTAIREISDTLTSDSTDSLQDQYKNRYTAWSVENAPFSFMYNLGDVIIVWRTYAFYMQSTERWLLVLPTALLIGSFTVSAIISYCVANGAVSELSNFIDPPLCVNIQITSYAMTFATTAVATLMICWKTWSYRRVVHYDRSDRKTRAEKILIVLIESGFIYLIFLLAVLIDDVGDVPVLEWSKPELIFATEVWSYMLSHIVGIYPTVIVILVHTQKSYIDCVSTATIDKVPTQSSIKFSMPSTSNWGCPTRANSDGHLPGSSHVLHIDVHELQETHGGSSFHERSATTELESQKSRELLKLSLYDTSREDDKTLRDLE